MDAAGTARDLHAANRVPQSAGGMTTAEDFGQKGLKLFGLGKADLPQLRFATVSNSAELQDAILCAAKAEGGLARRRGFR